MNTILKTENIDKFFHEPTEFQVLKNIHFEVQKGEFLSMIGKSGSGKSTLLYILSTMDTDYKGNLFIDNQLTTGLSKDQLAKLRNEKIGFVFQFHYLLAEFSCLRNVMIPALKLGKLSEKEIEERAYQKLEILGLKDQALKPASKLSGGQQQRVAIARAVSTSPRLLLADEPTGNLDRESSEAVMRLFRELWSDGLTIIMITHDAAVARAADRRVEISDGRLMELS